MDLFTIGILLLLLILVIVLVIMLRRRKPADTEKDAGENKDTKTKEKETNKKARSKKAKENPKKRKQEKSTEKAAPRQRTVTTDTSTGILGGPTAGPAPLAPVGPAGSTVSDGEKIRILLVDDNTGTRENVSRLLYFEDDLEVIGQAINGRQGLEMTIELKPHIVLMDINMPDMDGITATKEMLNKAPYSQVIIMSVQSDPHYMKQAMAAGARDFQPKPVTSEELVSCIRRVYKIGLPTYRQLEALEQAEEQQKSQPVEQQKKVETTIEGAPLIVIYSPKGGVGTSAIAANLAVAMHQEQGDIVLMDAVLQAGDILVHLNTRPTRTISDTVQEEGIEEDLVFDVLLPHDSGIRLLLAPPQPELAEMITPAMVVTAAKTLKNQFSAVVIDTTSKLTEHSLALLDAADQVILVINPELPAIKSAKLFLELTDALEYDQSKIQVVINKAGIPGAISTKQIKKVLNLEDVHRVPHDPKLYIALNQGRAVCQQEPSLPSSIAIKELAHKIIEKFPRPDKAVEEPAKL